MKQKSLLLRIFCRLFFKESGTIWNNYGSLLSPKEIGIATSLEMRGEVETLLSQLIFCETTSPLECIGSENDGAYVLPTEVIKHSNYLISGGIEDNNDFEIELATRGLRGIQVDNSIEAPPRLHTNLSFRKATLSPQEDRQNISLNQLLANKELHSTIVKLDIEGAELPCLLSLQEDHWKSISALTMELHNLDRIADEDFSKDLLELLTTISNNGLFPVFAKANNCCGAVCIGGYYIPRNIEITFVHKKFISGPASAQKLIEIRDLGYRIINVRSKSPVNMEQILFSNLHSK